MKVYYLLNTELGWDSLACIAVSPQKCIESYTDGEIIFKTEEEAWEYVKKSGHLHMGYKFIKE